MVAVACLCPPKATGEVRHPAGDEITLRERLDFRAALTARNTMVLLKEEDPDVSSAEILAALTETYLVLGIESWSLVDAKGKPLPVSKAAIREVLLTKPDIAMEVGDAADALYSAAVILPLLARAQTSSRPTPTNGSTSVTTPSLPKPPKRSRRSSITTIPTAATAPTSPSPAGDSSSSPNSA
jgi:hypothetical protein